MRTGCTCVRIQRPRVWKNVQNAKFRKPTVRNGHATPSRFTSLGFWVFQCRQPHMRLTGAKSGRALRLISLLLLWISHAHREFPGNFESSNVSRGNVSTVSFHNFKSQNFKLSVSNPKSIYVAYLSVLSQISNCQSLGRKNKHEILKTDRREVGRIAPTSLTSNSPRDSCHSSLSVLACRYI